MRWLFVWLACSPMEGRLVVDIEIKNIGWWFSGSEAEHRITDIQCTVYRSSDQEKFACKNVEIFIRCISCKLQQIDEETTHRFEVKHTIV